MLNIAKDFFTWINSQEIKQILLQPEIIAFAATFLLGIIGRLFTPKAKVIWGTQHMFSFRVPQQNNTLSIPLNTCSIFMQNTGRALSKDIEVYFNYKPEHMEIWPIINHSTIALADNRFILKFPYLKPREFVSIELVHTHSSVPEVLSVRAVNGECKQVAMEVRELFGPIFNCTVIAIFFLGVYQIVSWIIRYLQYAVS